MERITIFLVFENSNGGKSRLKISDVRPNVTSQEASELGEMIVTKNAIVKNNVTYVRYLNSELEQTTISIL